MSRFHVLAAASIGAIALLGATTMPAQPTGTRLLREPTISATHIAFTYAADLWIVPRAGGEARRLTSTPAVESNPHFSPDGASIAFTSTRSGGSAVYVMPAAGGDAMRLTWSPAGEEARGWSPDGKLVLFASGRASAPTDYAKLFTIPVAGGPAKQLPAYMGFRGSFSPDGQRIVVDRMDRWDVEFRSYRGGQNTPLTITTVADGTELRLPNELTMDIDPVWLGETIYFLSDRDWATNVWSYDTRTKAVKQLTTFENADVKALDGVGNTLVFEQDGYLWTLDPAKGQPQRLSIAVRGDFPWAMARHADVTSAVQSAAIGPNGKRALMESRGEIFTVPVEKGDARNLTRSSGAADRAPVWSPDGARVAWFSDEGQGYRLLIGDADGSAAPRAIAIGDVKMVWNPAWSPDGSRIAFVDDKVRLRTIEVASGRMAVIDTAGAANDRGSMVPAWSPDSKWLAYAKTFSNQFRRVVVYSFADGRKRTLTDALASAGSPVWDRNGKWLYFLASTDLGVGSGWADVGSQTRTSTSAVYVALLRANEPSPFTPESDEEAAARAAGTPAPGTPAPADSARTGPRDSAARGGAAAAAAPPAPAATAAARVPVTTVDFDRIDRRILALTLPTRDYAFLVPGPAGILFVGERIRNQPGTTLHKWDMSRRRADVFTTGVTTVSTTADGKKLMWRAGTAWAVVGADAPPRAGDGALRVSLSTLLDPPQEWAQIFDEAWRIERDFFYDPALHGADWNAVRARYLPLVPFIKHRADLTYVIDQVGGELAVGHSFVGGGDYPPTDSSRVGALGADLVADGDRWRLARIFTSESWNPGLRAPLDAPGVKARVGDYLLEVNGVSVTARDEPWKALDGTADRQTVLRLAERANGEGSWTVTVVPLRSEAGLRQRAWVEDNRRRVDSLSNGTLAYAWIPNTGAPAVTAFDRYYYAQQDRKGAVIDERFNGGGLLDDYMVGAMLRKPVGGVTDFVPGAQQLRLPASGIFGPKVLLTNELAGSGGDFFPWVFRQTGVGPLIGTRTWGGLVNASVPYPLVDGGTITAPALAVFGPQGYIAEGEGVAPDIEVLQDAKAVLQGRDPQLERAVREAMRLVTEQKVTVPARPATIPAKAKRPPRR
ncbi:MAG TPA: PDZ domain-containing protein [Gemmatimonas sp.]|nr:PDZ domain-containing protein [Gemmatimonas sp.]